MLAAVLERGGMKVFHCGMKGISQKTSEFIYSDVSLLAKQVASNRDSKIASAVVQCSEAGCLSRGAASDPERFGGGSGGSLCQLQVCAHCTGFSNKSLAGFHLGLGLQTWNTLLDTFLSRMEAIFGTLIQVILVCWSDPSAGLAN